MTHLQRVGGAKGMGVRRVIRITRLIGAIQRCEVDNLRNRLQAAQRSSWYGDRTHVDVPTDLVQRILELLEAQVPK